MTCKSKAAYAALIDSPGGNTPMGRQQYRWADISLIGSNACGLAAPIVCTRTRRAGEFSDDVKELAARYSASAQDDILDGPYCFESWQAGMDKFDAVINLPQQYWQ